MTNYTDFTSYNNPNGIDWNRINAEADANGELCMRHQKRGRHRVGEPALG
jgi:hypothetical protein